jgi:hypothetical protein
MKPNTPKGFKKTSYDEFFKEVFRFDCHPQIIGDYPYRSEYRTPSRRIVAISIDYYPDGRKAGLTKTSYFLPE